MHDLATPPGRIGCIGRYLIVCMLIFALIGCGGKSSHIGKSVTQENRITIIDGGPHEGLWETNIVKVNYQYNRQPDMLEISGKALLKRGRVVEYFSLSVYLVDGQGKINQLYSLVMAGGRNQINEFSFQKSLKLEPDTQSMVFGYRGATRGIGEGSGSTNDFWKAP